MDPMHILINMIEGLLESNNNDPNKVEKIIISMLNKSPYIEYLVVIDDNINNASEIRGSFPTQRTANQNLFMFYEITAQRILQIFKIIIIMKNLRKIQKMR